MDEENGKTIGFFIGPSKRARKKQIPVIFFVKEKKVSIGIGKEWKEDAASEEEAIKAAEEKARNSELKFETKIA